MMQDTVIDIQNFLNQVSVQEERLICFEAAKAVDGVTWVGVEYCETV